VGGGNDYLCFPCTPIFVCQPAQSVCLGWAAASTGIQVNRTADGAWGYRSREKRKGQGRFGGDLSMSLPAVVSVSTGTRFECWPVNTCLV
jgi:hypothetical protein